MTMAVPPIRDQHSTSEDTLIIAVRDALSAYNPVRMWGDCVQLDAHGSTILLSGNIRNHSAKEIAEQITRQVPRVTAVENNLVVDLDTELAVAQALGSDPRTQSSFPGILVGVVFGYVYLKGTVQKAETKTAAGEIASKIAGVRIVSNELNVAAPAQPVQKPSTPKAQAAAQPA